MILSLVYDVSSFASGGLLVAVFGRFGGCVSCDSVINSVV